MFCTHCGKQLPDGTRFCVFCGTAQQAAPAAEPVTAPVAEPAANPEVQTPVAESLAEDSFINAVAVEEATYDTPFIATADYTPPKRSPAPKKKKTGVIIAVILVLVLLAGAAAGVYFWLDHRNSTAYADATAMLEAGDINGALTAFEDLGDYEDSAKMVKNLKKYQQGLKKLDAHEYDEAREIFEGLGRFHDSKTYVASGVDYHMANYLMDCAKKRDPAGLSLLPLGDSYAESGDETIYANEQYFAAAEIFDTLGDYQDSAKLASACRFGMAEIELNWGNVEDALRLQELMNDEDAAELQAMLEERSADATVLEDMKTALKIYLDDAEQYTLEEELRKACEHMQVYGELFFLDPELEKLYGEFMDALNTQLDAIKSGDEVDNYVKRFEGIADLCLVCDKLYEKYGFLKGTDLEGEFIGSYETCSKYPIIEASLEEQLTGTAPWSDEGYYYSSYTNDTGIDFKVTITIKFYKGNTYLETGKPMDYTVAAGETIQVPLIPVTLKDGEFDGWVAHWIFTLK